MKRVTDIMAEITAASQEQSSGIEQVNQAITQMDEVTQQNAALVEQAAAAAGVDGGAGAEPRAGGGVFKLAHAAAGTRSRCSAAALPEGERRFERAAGANDSESSAAAAGRAKNVARLPAKNRAEG